MKPCNKNRQLIALLVIEELDPSQKRHLLAHFDQCAGCQAYFDELSGIAGALMSRKSPPTIETTERFHANLLRQLRGSSYRSTWLDLLRQYCFALANWRVVLPSFGTALVLVAVFAFWRPAPVPVRPASIHEIASTQHLNSDIDPTISNYRMAAAQSFEKFDQLLTDQASRNPAPTAIYTAAAKPLVIGD